MLLCRGLRGHPQVHAHAVRGFERHVVRDLVGDPVPVHSIGSEHEQAIDLPGLMQVRDRVDRDLRLTQTHLMEEAPGCLVLRVLEFLQLVGERLSLEIHAPAYYLPMALEGQEKTTADITAGRRPHASRASPRCSSSYQEDYSKWRFSSTSIFTCCSAFCFWSAAIVACCA